VRHRINPLFVGSLLALVSFDIAAADQLADGKAAIRRDDFASALRLLLPLADQGNADAQFEIGALYNENLQGHARNDTEAFKYYSVAASQGHAHAMFMVSFMYCNGEGVIQNLDECWKWLKLSAETGYSDAQLYVGWAYERGNYSDGGVLGARNYAEAAKWFRLAADQNERFAQEALGRLYSAGDGVPEDYVISYMWFNLAAAREPPPPWSSAKQGREAIEKLMTPEQIAEAQKLSREWVPK